MARALRAFWAAIKDVFEEFVLLAFCNVVWALVSLPLVLLSFLLLSNGIVPMGVAVAFLAVIPLAPATVAFAAIAQRVTEGRTSKIRDFFAAMRRYAVPAWKVMGLWVAGLTLIIINLQFYVGMNNFISGIVQWLWLYLLLVWLSLLIYIFPLIILQTEPNLRILARNAFLMSMGRPLFTLVTMVLMGLIVVLTYLVQILLPLMSIALLVQASMRATQALIKEAEERRAAAEATTNPPPIVEEKGRRGQVRPK